jgi:aspartyl-tRNA(Asn)/glutamyl-tRNA(Gln) amidotransferase subunit B
MYISGNTGDWEYVIGLEVHAQVSSKAKLFSSAATAFGADPNSQVSFIDAAMPGMLPTLNEECVRQAIKTGLGINGKINKFSAFDRKNYFYPDLPSGYQITQFYHPIVLDGFLEIMVGDSIKKIGIERIHLEQDAGKSIHDQSPEYTFIDLNRAGIALMEIVTAPDMRSPEEAALYLKKLRSTLRYLETCDGDMEKGSLRCDANVSVRKPGGSLGTRCEIKNLNSIKNIVKAIEYEALRQVGILEGGGSIDQETRLFDVASNKTRLMRSKENALDYRYFPDPDLPPLILEDDYILQIAQNMPQLPCAKERQYMQDYNLSKYDAGVLVAEKETAYYFEEVCKSCDPKLAANWIIGELFSCLNKSGISIEENKILPQNLACLINLVSSAQISGKMAKEIFLDMFASGQDPQEIIDAKGLVQISDQDVLAKIIDEVLAKNQDSVAEYKAGREKLFAFFVGQVMKQTAGKASPAVINELLKSKLKQN